MHSQVVVALFADFTRFQTDAVRVRRQSPLEMIASCNMDQRPLTTNVGNWFKAI